MPTHVWPLRVAYASTDRLCFSIPLSYNFLLLLPPTYRRSAFDEFLGSNINLTPLGEKFISWFPLFIVIPFGLTLARMGDRLKQWLGLDADSVFHDDEGELESARPVRGSQEGRMLLLNSRTEAHALDANE